MDIRETLLLSVCRSTDSNDFAPDTGGLPDELPLALLEREYRDFTTIVRGKRIVDFGSGLGLQSLALAQDHGCTVVGIDSNDAIRAEAEAKARAAGLAPGQLSFVAAATPEMAGGFDVVISQNSFEHFGDPASVLALMRDLIHDSGCLLVSFGPPWYAPYGSHMHFFCKLPWINVLFPEKVVMNVRNRFRDDGATRYEEVESGLNRMSVGKFERIIRASGLRIDYQNYRCVKGVNLLGRIPIVRELFINHISVILSPETGRG